MTDKLNKLVADSLETDEKMLPLMPYLLQDLWAMGCAINRILEIVSGLEFSGREIKTLDLGCGKGAVAVNIARQFGHKVTGVDAMPEFLREAKSKAGEHLVGHLCSFIQADILEFVKQPKNFDLVILASLGGIFGNFRETMAKLRSQVREGGYILIDDGYLKYDNNSTRKGYAHYRNYKQTRTELTVHGDLMVEEISTAAESQEINMGYLDYLKKRGRELSIKNPAWAEDIAQYIASQKEECDFLDEKIEGMIWVLKKT